ncbi:MAG TPA: secondary thiamine-phosphate synthase enzyme YjbQ [Nitrospirales bacterium]|jgi:secondary thiamine-phosphate synthase enzyme
MSVKSFPLQLKLRGDTQVENITKRVTDAVSKSQLTAGIAVVFIKHTTAAVMVVEDEPGIRADTKTIWERLIPPDSQWQHNTLNEDDNAHSHLRAHLQGCSVTVPFADGSLLLGTWQQIVVVDFDTRARTRDLIIQLIGE